MMLWRVQCVWERKGQVCEARDKRASTIFSICWQSQLGLNICKLKIQYSDGVAVEQSKQDVTYTAQYYISHFFLNPLI